MRIVSSGSMICSEQKLQAQGQTRFVDQLNTMGLSPLHTATLRGSASTVQALLQVELFLHGCIRSQDDMHTTLLLNM